MSSFGCTTLGPKDPISENARAHNEYAFHALEPEAYEEAFSKYLLGENSQLATVLEVDGSSHVLRASLGDMLRELIGRQPRKHELDAWFTALDFDRSALLGVEEYRWEALPKACPLWHYAHARDDTPSTIAHMEP